MPRSSHDRLKLLHWSPMHTATRNWLLFVLLLPAAGCGNNGRAPFGPEVDRNDVRWAKFGVEPEPRTEAEENHQANDWSEPHERDLRERNDRWTPGDFLPSRTERWGSDRESAGDFLPSRTEPWGADREMPSQTERWGGERRMPSESMPSQTERWGSERQMPSDSFGQDSVFDE